MPHRLAGDQDHVRSGAAVSSPRLTSHIAESSGACKVVSQSLTNDWRTQSVRNAGANWRRRLLPLPDPFSSTASWLSATTTRAASRAHGSSNDPWKRSA